MLAGQLIIGGVLSTMNFAILVLVPLPSGGTMTAMLPGTVIEAYIPMTAAATPVGYFALLNVRPPTKIGRMRIFWVLALFATAMALRSSTLSTYASSQPAGGASVTRTMILKHSWRNIPNCPL